MTSQLHTTKVTKQFRRSRRGHAVPVLQRVGEGVLDRFHASGQRHIVNRTVASRQRAVQASFVLDKIQVRQQEEPAKIGVLGGNSKQIASQPGCHQ